MVYKVETSLQHIRHIINRYRNYYRKNAKDPEVFNDILNRMQKNSEHFDFMMGVMAIDFFTCEFKLSNGYFGDVEEEDVLLYGLVHDMSLDDVERIVIDDPSILEELMDSTWEISDYPIEGRYEMGHEIIALGYESIYARFHPFYHMDVQIYKANEPTSSEEVMEEEFYDDYLVYASELKDYFKCCDALAYNLATGTTFPLSNDHFWHRFIDKYYRFAKGMDHIFPEMLDPMNHDIIKKIETSSCYDEVRDYLVCDTDRLSEAVNQYVQSLDLSFDPIQKKIDDYDKETGMMKIFTRYK